MPEFSIRYAWRRDDPVGWNETREAYYFRKHMVAQRLQPASIVEIGVRSGYSAFAFLAAAPGARYDGFDCLDLGYPEQKRNIAHARYLVHTFDAEIHIADTQTLDELPGSWEMAHVDGDHSYEGCAHDIRLCHAAGCKWIVVDDTGWMDAVMQATHDTADELGLSVSVLDEPYRGMTLLT